jgi:hypothetical protein
MHWTFAYYDTLSARDVLTMLELWKLEENKGAASG